MRLTYSFGSQKKCIAIARQKNPVFSKKCHLPKGRGGISQRGEGHRQNCSKNPKGGGHRPILPAVNSHATLDGWCQ